MITGFNTDIEHDGVVYHVQTEDKGVETPIILSLVYVGGAILASKRSPYDDLVGERFDASVVNERLQRQHKLICAAITAGRIEDLKRLNRRDGEEQPAAQKAPRRSSRQTREEARQAREDAASTRPDSARAETTHAEKVEKLAPRNGKPGGATRTAQPASQTQPGNTPARDAKAAPHAPSEASPLKTRTDAAPATRESVRATRDEARTPREGARVKRDDAPAVEDILAIEDEPSVQVAPAVRDMPAVPAARAPVEDAPAEVAESPVPVVVEPVSAPPARSKAASQVSAPYSDEAIPVEIDGALHVTLMEERDYHSGEIVTLRVRVSRGPLEGREAVGDAAVTVKILGTEFRPLILTSKTDQDGVAIIHAWLPRFSRGRAAILIRAACDGYTAELRRAIRHL